VIKPVDKFLEYVFSSKELAEKGYIVTFGIKPTRPETGYGYIEMGEPVDKAYLVKKFTEKPDSETAKEYVSSGRFLWNSGMFAFTVGTIIEEFKTHAPEIASVFDKSLDEVLKTFEKLPNISIDYAIMEKTERIVVLPLEIYWNDIGSWDSVVEILSREKEERENIVKGKANLLGSKNCLVWGDEREVVGIGLEDLIIVDTRDALLVAKKGHTQEVKKAVELLKKKNSKTVEEHITVYRPWGSYTVLEVGPRYKIKRITVNPGARLSLQMHYHRSEHWVVVRGTAKVRIGNEDRLIYENESVFVPPATLHRLENPGKIPLEIIEIQTGEYVEEDDIVRFDDDWKREKS